MPVETISENYRWIFEYNPLTTIIDQARNVMLWGRMPDWGVLTKYLAVAAMAMYIGRAWFVATRRGFADVL
jgi:lipopolysaccharide transport system permease protein